jgi:hypothetical protein
VPPSVFHFFSFSLFGSFHVTIFSPHNVIRHTSKNKIQISTSDLNALIVDDPSSVSVKDAYMGERETLSSLRSSLDVDL